MSCVARKYNIRLVVKSSGHDYIGRSAAPNALSIWTHHLKQTPAMHTSFRPRGCPASVVIDGSAVTVGAGAQMDELYAALDAVNQTIVGGGGKTVSVGGYLTGGGHGLLAPRHGLGADQVLEMELVTPRGDLVVANECQNQRLFWAMRGVGPLLSPPSVTTYPSLILRADIDML